MIIDFHTHPYLERSQNICAHLGHVNESVDYIPEYFHTLGIDMICGSVITKTCDPFEGKEKNWAVIARLNEAALELQERWGNFYVPGFHVSPDFVEESCREIERMSKLGLRLIGELVPGRMGWDDYSCEAFDVILDVATAHNMVVNFHSQHKDNMDRMVQKHPDTVFVAAHPGEYADYLRHLARMKMSKNYYLDLSGTGLFRYAMLRRGIDEMGVERFVFGSDFPTCGTPMFLGGVAGDPLLTEEEKEMILCTNAKRLLGL